MITESSAELEKTHHKTKQNTTEHKPCHTDL